MADTRRRPDEFLDEVRAINARRETPQFDVATADQMQAANRDARRIMGQSHELVIDVDGTDERGLALLLALAYAADRRGVRPTRDPANPAIRFIDLRTGRRGHCDVCDARAHIREEMTSQYGPYIYRARVCVRCRKFAPGKPVDEAA